MLQPSCILFLLYFPLMMILSFNVDPSDFFTGSKPMPRLEIEHPENGQVLEDNKLEIRLSVKGYSFPSSFHDCSICIALSKEDSFAEECFDQSEALSFHVNGLVPGAQYALRVVLFERGKAIAVSVRNFRVGAIFGLLENEQAVTVNTAIQHAITYQSDGSHAIAEKIYRQVLDAYPSHPDALHLIGLIYYQRGDPGSAIPYIERALSTNKTFEGFHNSLGECFRVVGRFEEAKSQFELALVLNPKYPSAAFNLGLTYQASRQYEKAIHQYQQLETWGAQGSAVTLLVNSKIRECDLYQALGRLKEAFICWREGTEKYRDNDIFYNELGNFYGQFGKHMRALELYQQAAALGSFISELNAAHMLELLGRSKESRSAFAVAISRADAQGLPSFHLKIRRATVLPRITPRETELNTIRRDFEKDLDILQMSDAVAVVDNTPPLFFGFSLGHLLTFHGDNNRNIREKLYRVYMKYCPALSQGFFIDHTFSPAQTLVPQSAGQAGAGLSSIHSVHTPEGGRTTKSSRKTTQKRIGFLSRFFHSHHGTGFLVEGLVPLLVRKGYHVTVFAIDDAKYFDELSMVLSMNLFHQADVDFDRDGGLIDSIIFDADRHEGRVNSYPLLKDDIIRNKLMSDASEFVFLPADMNKCAAIVRNAHIDLLVYPEIGLDPISYFLSFARLAPTQALLMGDGDTTGIPTIDYIIISDGVGPFLPEKAYSETVYSMRGMGTVFVDRYAEVSQMLLHSPRSTLLDRARFAETLSLPRAAHLYVIASPLPSLHPRFDEILVKILSRDPLGCVVFLDATNRTALQRQYLDRLFSFETSASPSGKEPSAEGVSSFRKRIVFYSSVDEVKNLQAIAAAHVVLDPPRTAGFLGTLQALSLGIPVVSLVEPSGRMTGRFGQALYNMMNYTDLLAQSPGEYVHLALQLAHSTKLRAEHSQQISQRRSYLFEKQQDKVAQDWNSFFETCCA